MFEQIIKKFLEISFFAHFQTNNQNNYVFDKNVGYPDKIWGLGPRQYPYAIALRQVHTVLRFILLINGKYDFGNA